MRMFLFDRLKRYLTKYLDWRSVLVMDFVLSVLSSFITLMILNYARPGIFLSTKFVLVWMVSSMVFTVVAMYAVKTYRAVIRRSTMSDIGKLFIISLVKFALMNIAVFFLTGYSRSKSIALVVDMVMTVFFLVSVRIVMMAVYEKFRSDSKASSGLKKMLIFGISDKSAALVNRFASSPHYAVIGFISDNPGLRGLSVSGKPLYFFDNEKYQISDIISESDADCVLFATESDARKYGDLFVKESQNSGLKVLVAPSVDDVSGGVKTASKLRSIRIEDLLGRDEIEIDMSAIKSNFSGKVVLVTGAAGSIGSELCRQLARLDVKKIVLFDNAETPMHNFRLELEEKFPDLEFVPIIGDVRQIARIDFAFRTHRPDIVFHAAAYKHVPLMEENPCEAVLVNVYGTRNLADKCIEYDVKEMIMISTDKAVNPTNIMGCTKRLAEIYVQSLGLAVERGEVNGKTKFVTTRFGNVLGSNGSVIPFFRKQIKNGGPVTVTHPDITRFFMTIPEACRLVMEAAAMSKGNQIFVFDMGESVKIDTLAKRMIELSGLKLGVDIDIVYTGLRPGEKLYEEVLSNKENTDPTSHDRIRIAKVREYPYEDAVDFVGRLEVLSRAVNIPDMVILMKKAVPEFISKNSVYEKYDKIYEN